MAKIEKKDHQGWKNNTQTFLEFPEFHAEASQVPVIAVIEINPSALLINAPMPDPEQKHTDVICADVPEQQLPSITEQPDVFPDMPLEESDSQQPLCVTETCIHESRDLKIIEINACGLLFWKLFDASPDNKHESSTFLAKTGLHFSAYDDAMHRFRFLSKKKDSKIN